MSLFTKRNAAPLDARDKALRSEMARLEAELRKLATEAPTPARKRPRPVSTPPEPAKPAADFPAPLPCASAATTIRDTDRFNERGVRKFDLVALFQDMKNHLSGPTGNNPAMAKMLAAGGIHGLRPLRRERRVARNRFVFLFVTLLAILWGVAYTYLRQR